MHKNNKKLNSIQFLRGLAAMLVVMFHFRTDLALTFPIADRIFGCGSIGVDLFFMISGFIVYYVIKNENKGIASSYEFMIKRLCRISPPYIIATLFVAGKSWDAWQVTLSSFLFLPKDTSQIAPYFGYAKLNVGWTLNYEFMFYSLTAVALIFRRSKFIILTTLVIVLVAIPYSITGPSDVFVKTNYGLPGYLALLTNGMMFEFIAGILAGWITLRNYQIGPKFAWQIALIISVAYFLYVAFGFGSGLGNGQYGFVTASFFLLLVITGYESRFEINPPLFFTAVGTISFSVYLMHKRGMSIASKVIYRIYDGDYAGLLVTVIALVLTAIFSLIFYRYIEVKLCNLIRRKFFSQLL
ncbi:acyltransferase [Pantoea allii]|nr:acyltransferase [Pantoea allii]THB85286.1 acyltransferase [Pantoea allii]